MAATISISITTDLMAPLRRVAKRKNTDASKFVRQLVRQLLEEIVTCERNRSMTVEEMVAAFIAKNGVTVCPSARPESGVNQGTPPPAKPKKPRKNPFQKE